MATKEREEIKGTTKQDDTGRKEGTTWNRKATDRGQWKALIDGYILKCMDKAEMK